MDVFGGAPRFLAYPRPVVVQTGTDAVLKCQISGDPRPAVIWERNNEKIHPGGRYRVFEDGNIYNLIITVVIAEDSGQYICKAKNCIGETYAAATLKVEGEAQEMELREENKPRFLIKPLSTRVGRGDDAVFSCKLWGKPRPEVVWEKDGKKLNEIFESTHFSVGYQDGGWFQLKIFKTRAPDGGVYTCKARNEFGESLAGAVLLVDAGPGHEDEGNRNGYTNGHRKSNQGKQRSSRHVVTRLKENPLPTSAKVKMFAVTEGKHAKFRCYVTGKPKPEIIWRKDGRIILSGRRYLLYEDREGYFTLKVLYCKQQDNGVYVCAASNTAGQTISAVHLFVKEPPVRFKQPLNDLEVWEQDLAVLECEVPEDSVPITWYLEDRRLQPGAKYGMEEWGTKRRLTIRDMGMDDDGIYLCEMPDGGRSIAEVTVKGTIIRKLPRKVDVLEGENAAFCVEVEEEEMDIHWYKDGTELRETHQTIIKSFGRTHILVFVNTTPQDSGMVIFYVGRSKTSSQLRVKAIRQCPPSCPVGVQINTERANAALLSWVPAQDSRKNPPSCYILERQEIGSQEWLQCLTTDSATQVEILGDSVPCEADYRFRICSINKYGRSGYVEFPRAVHLVPVAKVQAPLQDALVPEGQDASFSIELSASVIGTWFWNGNQIQEDERFLIRRSRTHQSLRIRGVRDTDNGAEITFIAYGIRDSAALYLQAPLVKFTPLSEMDRNKFVEIGNPIVLYCELSDPKAPVRWYKNGIELHSVEGLHIQSEGTMRRIVIQSAEFSHSGVYSCDAIDDVIRFNVEVEAPPVSFIALPNVDRNMSIEAGRPIVLQCELTDPSAQVYWYKDEAKLLPQNGLNFQSNGTKRALIVEKANFFHSGVYSCKTKGAVVQFNVEIKAPPVRFSACPEAERRKCIEAGDTIVLQCEISDASGQVRWFKDGKQIFSQSGRDFQSEGCIRRLIIESAAQTHCGVYRCTTNDDITEFQVEIKAVPVRFSTVPEVEKNKCIEAGNYFDLCCEVSDPTADVQWYKDEREILTDTGWDIRAENTLRKLVVQSAEPNHSGLYSCKMNDECVQFTVDIKAPSMEFSAFPGIVKNRLLEEDYPTALHCEISDPLANICWYEDGVELLSKSEPLIKMEDIRRSLTVNAAQPSLRNDEVIKFNVQNEAPPLKLLDVSDVEKSKCAGESMSITQQCKILESPEYSCQQKDEAEILIQDGTEPEPQIKWEVPTRILSIASSETIDNGTNRPRTPDDHTQFNKAEQSHSEEYRGETYDDTVQCTVDMKAESFTEIAKTNIIKESLGISDGYEFAKSKQTLGFPQVMTTPELAKNEVNKEGSSFTDIPKLTKNKNLKESLSYTTVPVLAEIENTNESLSVTEFLEFSKSKNVQKCLSSTTVPELEKAENITESLSFTDGYVSKSKNFNKKMRFIADPDSAKTENSKESSSFTNSSNVSISKNHKESLSFEADPDLAKTENSKESLSFTNISNVSISKNHKKSLRFDADPDLAKNGNSKESSSFTNSSNVSISKNHKESLSFEADPAKSNTENSKESLSFTNSSNVSISKNHKESLSFEADPDLAKTENSKESLTFTNSSNVSISKNHKESLSFNADTDLAKNGNSKESSSFTNSSNVSISKNHKESLRFDADPDLAKNGNSKESSSFTNSSNVSISKNQKESLRFDADPDLAKNGNSKESLTFTNSSNVSISKNQKESLRFDADPDLAKNGNSKESFTNNSNVSIRKDYKESLSFEADPALAKTENSKESLSFTNSSNISISKNQKESLSFDADPDLAKNENSKESSSFTNSSNVSISKNHKESLSFEADPAKSNTENSKESLSLTHGSDFAKCEIIMGSLNLTPVSKLDKAENSKEILSFANCPGFTESNIVNESLSFAAVPELLIKENIKENSLKQVQHEISDSTAPFCIYKDKELSQPQCIKPETTCRFQDDGRSNFVVQELYKDDDVLAFKVDREVAKMHISAPQDMLDEKAFEGAHLKDLHEVSEKEALNFGHVAVSIVQQQEGKNRMFNLTSKEQSAMLSEIPCKEVLTTETNNQSVMHQDKVKAHSPKKVKFAPIPETGRTKTIESGMPLVLQCEISDPDAPVCWFKDGIQLQSKNGIVIQSKDCIRRLVVPKAELCHTGLYNCEALDDVIIFKVYVKAARLKGSPLTKTEKIEIASDEADNASFTQKEPINSTAQISWNKQEQQNQERLTVIRSEEFRSEEITSAELSDSGVYSYETKDNNILSALDPPAPTAKFSNVSEAQRNISSVAEEPFALECEVSDAAAYACWYKDRNDLSSEAGVLVQSEGTSRKLSVPSAESSHSGTYDFKTDADAITFNVDQRIDIKASHKQVETSTRLKPLSDVERDRSTELDSPSVPKQEISDSISQVCWYKDGTELLANSGLVTQREENVGNVTIRSTELSDIGHFICGSPVDAVSFKMDSQATPVRFSALPEVARNKFIEAGFPIILHCEISESAAQVSWFKDGVKVLQETGTDIKSEGTMRALIIQSAELKHSGLYSCEAADDRIAFKVDVAASPVMFTAVPEIEKTKSFEARSPIILQCEISEPTAMVQWYKDGTQLFPQSGVFFKSEHTRRTLVILSATFSHSGVYSCNTADDISEFYVDIKAPPVTFVYMPEEELHRNVVEQDNLFLCCEVTRCDATTQWYKDGVEIQDSDKVIIDAIHTMRKLIIQSVQLTDAGTYICRAGGSALIFKVNVREPPILIVYPKEDVHLDRHVPEEIVLSCELSRPNGKVTWFKDGQKLQESENIKLKIEGPYRRLKILHSKVEDSGEYVCDTADDSKFFHLNIKEPPVRIVSPSQSQMELCQQMSERMVLSCEISRANASVRWYRNGLEVEENNNLILEVDGVYRRLIIPETTVSDSAEYVCDTVDDSVTFFVNIAEPPVRFIRPRKMAYEVERFVGETVVLDCEVSRANAEVSWKKNGDDIEENSNITITEDGSIRQLTIHSSRLEDTGQYLCDAKDDVMDFSLKIHDPPLKFLRKSDKITERHFIVSDAIVLKCELSRENGVVCWYKDNNRIVDKDHFTFEEEGSFRSLIILNAEIGDTGEYICYTKDDKMVINVTVQEGPVSILRNSQILEHYSPIAGNELILECEVSRENATIQWLYNGRVLQTDARTHIENRGTKRKLVLSNLQVSDSGEYICDATDDKMSVMVTVQEPPYKFIKREKINIAAYEEESVTLSAVVNRDNGSVQWSKEGKQISDHRFYARSEGQAHSLTINHVRKSDAGEYECDVGTDKAHFSLQVKPMKVKFSKPLQNVVGFKGSDVVLRCELHTAKGDVQWLKNNKEITPSRHFTIRTNGHERSLTIHNLTDEDSGEYTCESMAERTSATVEVKTPRVVEFIAELHSTTVIEGEDARFKCVVAPEDAKIIWCMNGRSIKSNERFKISRNGLCHMLYIRNCQLSDSCKLTAEAEGMISKAILQVQEKQVLFTKNMESVVAEEFGEATFEVELDLECGEVQWMRQGVVIQSGPKFTLKQNGQKRLLTILNLALSDRGTYSCETLHDRTQAELKVEPRKVKILKGLNEIQTFERETATFEVELTHSNVEGMWLKDGNRLKNNNHWRMTTKGKLHSLTIANLSLEDTGTYTFATENSKSSSRLTIKEIPVSILKKLLDSTFPEGTGATLECELSKYNVTVKWTKNGEELKPGKNHCIYSMGRKCFLQILRCELGDSGVYVCDAGDATTSCTVEIYERKVEVLHSLEDLDIQEDQNAVFMCEVSLDNIPGEWFKNGEKIKPTNTIKIRQEGTKHFLLMCNVKEEDSGEIKFAAKNVESIAYLEVEKLPVNIVKPLQDKTALENTRVLLDCTVSNPRCSIRWYKGRNVILPSGHFEICSEGCYRKLVIQEVAMEDAGMYSVQVGENTSSARLTVEAQTILMVQELQDLEVSAPEEACFLCEVSVPLIKSPIWTLNGEVLKAGPNVLLEKMGTVHKLTLKHTAADMNGDVVFDSGKAKSTAKLHVK